MTISPETRKIFIYGGVSIVAGLAVFYLWSKYGNAQNGNAQSASDAATQANDQAAQQALADEQSLAELSLLGSGSPSIGSGGGLSSTSISPVELPQDNFAAEVASILQSAGIANPSQPASPVNTSAPVSATTPTTPTTPPHTVTAPHTVRVAPDTQQN
jgi:hypothetical protein